MKKVKHTLEFVTEFDENHPIAQRILSLPLDMQENILSGLLKTELAPRIQPVLDEINAGGSYAILKVAE